jgi:hypothetical protein
MHKEKYSIFSVQILPAYSKKNTFDHGRTMISLALFYTTDNGQRLLSHSKQHNYTTIQTSLQALQTHQHGYTTRTLSSHNNNSLAKGNSG